MRTATAFLIIFIPRVLIPMPCTGIKSSAMHEPMRSIRSGPDGRADESKKPSTDDRTASDGGSVVGTANGANGRPDAEADGCSDQSVTRTARSHSRYWVGTSAISATVRRRHLRSAPWALRQGLASGFLRLIVREMEIHRAIGIVGIVLVLRIRAPRHCDLVATIIA
jgi:hypothetical protein